LTREVDFVLAQPKLSALKMGFFSRRAGRDGPAAAPRASRHHGHAAEPYPMATRPSFGQWLKVTWLDILTMIAMGAIGLGVSISLPHLSLDMSQ